MSTIVNIISIFMAVCAGILGIISYIPGIKDWLDISTPSLSHYFLATILIILTSKFITLYLILYWRTSPEYTEQSLHNIFIWSYFVSILMGIFVYFNFAVGQQQRETTLDHLMHHKIIAFFLFIGILFFYGFSSIYSYNQSNTTLIDNKSTPLSSLFKSIGIISAIDFILFGLLWVRFWVIAAS